MVTVSASHYRVFSIDPPHLPLPSHPGKMVPTGVITDAHHRGGHAYGRFLTDESDHIWYITAKFCEEFAEYRQAPPKKRASEMADILTLIEYTLPRVEGETPMPLKLCSMHQMESAWRSFQKELARHTVPDPPMRVLHLLKRTQSVTTTERRTQRLTWHSIREAQTAKARRIGSFEGWILTHLVLPSDDSFIPRLLASGWYEHQPDERGLFPGLVTAYLITKDQLQAVTLG